MHTVSNLHKFLRLDGRIRETLKTIQDEVYRNRGISKDVYETLFNDLMEYGRMIWIVSGATKTEPNNRITDFYITHIEPCIAEIFDILEKKEIDDEEDMDTLERCIDEVQHGMHRILMMLRE